LRHCKGGIVARPCMAERGFQPLSHAESHASIYTRKDPEDPLSDSIFAFVRTVGLCIVDAWGRFLCERPHWVVLEIAEPQAKKSLYENSYYWLKMLNCVTLTHSDCSSSLRFLFYIVLFQIPKLTVAQPAAARRTLTPTPQQPAQPDNHTHTHAHTHTSVPNGATYSTLEHLQPVHSRFICTRARAHSCRAANEACAKSPPG